MTFDYRASQLRTSKIIASGSTGTNAKLILYPISSQGSPANQGNISASLFGTGSIGSDIFLFVSGAVNSLGQNTNGASVFGGDLYVSGNLRTAISFSATAISASVINASTIDAESVTAFSLSGTQIDATSIVASQIEAPYIHAETLFATSSLGTGGTFYFKNNTAYSGTLTSSMTANRTWEFPNSDGVVLLTRNLLGDSVITVNTYSNGVVAISASIPTGSSPGSSIVYQFLAGYTTTLLTDPGTVCGQFAFEPQEVTTGSLTFRAVLSTITGSNTSYLKLYNHTSGAYVAWESGSINALSSSSTTPEKLEANLVGAVNFSTSSAVYEVQLFTSNSLHLAILGSAQLVCG